MMTYAKVTIEGLGDYTTLLVGERLDDMIDAERRRLSAMHPGRAVDIVETGRPRISPDETARLRKEFEDDR